jgi:hypothetical protein
VSILKNLAECALPAVMKKQIAVMLASSSLGEGSSEMIHYLLARRSSSERCVAALYFCFTGPLIWAQTLVISFFLV